MSILRKIVSVSFTGAATFIGITLGGTALASLVATYFGMKLPEFPDTLIGHYETFRSIIFMWTPYLPFPWPIWLSDAMTFYFSFALAYWRGIVAAYWWLQGWNTQNNLSIAKAGFGWPYYLVRQIRSAIGNPVLRHSGDHLDYEVLQLHFFSLGVFILTILSAVVLLQWDVIVGWVY